MNGEKLTLNELIDLFYEKILEKNEDIKELSINSLLSKNKELIASINYKNYKNLNYDKEIIKLMKNIIVLIKLRKIEVSNKD